MSTTINTSNVRAAGSVTSSSASRVEGSSPFTGSRALRDITSSKDFQANFSLSASSRGASGVVAADRGVRA
ncbi:MAG TPA: hypothetical protein VFX30_14200 [bacterium]|nr:hypothetical protein [bacterium]